MEGKAEFTANSSCPPDNDGLGWCLVGNENKPKRNIYAKLGDIFIGARDERQTQTTSNSPAESSASETDDEFEDPPPDRASPTSHHQFPNPSGMPYPRGYRPTPPPPDTKYEKRGGNFMPTLVFPFAKSDHYIYKTGDDNQVSGRVLTRHRVSTLARACSRKAHFNRVSRPPRRWTIFKHMRT